MVWWEASQQVQTCLARFTAVLQAIAPPQRIEDAGVERVVLPPRSPNVHTYEERWVRSVKEECLSRLILFGEAALCRALKAYLAHYQHERNHQGKGNVRLGPVASEDLERQGSIQCREWLDAPLKYYTP